MVKLSSIYPQMSDWSVAEGSISPNRFTSDIGKQNTTALNSIPCFDHVTNGDSTNYDKQKYLQ